MLVRRILLVTALTFATVVVSPAAASEATTAGATDHTPRKPRDRAKLHAKHDPSPRFPAVKVSVHGGKGIAKIAFYVCRDAIDSGIAFATPELADAHCAKKRESRGSKRRSAGRDVIAVYGP